MFSPVILVLAMVSSQPHVEHAVFDGVQRGSLPPVRVDRPLPARSADGSVVQADEPRWGPTRAVCSMPDWTHAWETPGSIRVLISGVERDGRTPVLVAINSQTLKLSLFSGDIATGPEFEWSLVRNDGASEHMDLLANHSLRRDDQAFAVRSGCMLPGCVLLHCDRSFLTDGQWISEGISVFALQQHASGWLLEHVSDGPRIGDGTQCLGLPRGWVSSMQNYYPVPSEGQMTEAFIPYVDYQNHLSGQLAEGGQCFLLKAIRDDVTDSPWSFEGPVLLHEFSGVERQHAHAAAWTPNGVLLAVGDSSNADVRLLTCEDWSNWTDLDQWTTHIGMHGELHPDGSAIIKANQFWAACPGSEPNEVLIGGDNVSTAVMSVEVPADPLNGLRFDRLWGRQFGSPSDDGQLQTTCSSLVAVRPEHGGPVLARVNREGNSYNEQYARILLSEDREHFATVARMTDGARDSSPMTIMGNTILQGRFLTSDQRGIWSMTLPHDMQIGRGLQAAPGGTDLLRGGGAVISPGSGTTVESVVRTSDPDGLPVSSAPGVGEVWRLSRGVESGSTIATIELPLTQDDCDGRTLLARTWMCNLSSSLLSIQQQFRHGDETATRRAKIVTERSWVPVPIMTRVDDFLPGACPSLKIIATSVGQDGGEIDLLMTIDGLFVDSMGTWRPLDDAAPATLPGERVVLPLVDVGDRWTIELDLLLPETGIDRGLGSRLDTFEAAVIMLKNGDEVHVSLKPAEREARLDLIRDGEAIANVSHVGVYLERLDTVQLRISGGPSRLGFEVRSGGAATTRVAAMPGVAAAVSGRPVSVRLGNETSELQTPLECHRVSIRGELHPMTLGFTSNYDATLPACAADLTGDGLVSVKDMLILIATWGPCDDSPCVADIDRSGVIDTNDLLIVLASWGLCDVPG